MFANNKIFPKSLQITGKTVPYENVLSTLETRLDKGFRPSYRLPNCNFEGSTSYHETPGPNVSVLHLRSTSEPWTISKNDENITRSLKLIFDMETGNIFRNEEHKYLLEPALSKKQPLPLPRRFINYKSEPITNGTDSKSYLKIKNGVENRTPAISSAHTDSPSALILEPPKRFSNEYSKDLTSKHPSRKKPDRESHHKSAAASYYPILSPPPGFQDDVKSNENTENINPIPALTNCDCFMYPNSCARVTSSSYGSMQRGAGTGYYRARTPTGTLQKEHKSPLARKSQNRRYAASCCSDYEPSAQFQSASYDDRYGMAKWRSNGDPFSEYAPYSYNCYCNHCRVGSVPSTLSNGGGGGGGNYPPVPAFLHEKENYDDICSVQTFNSFHEDNGTPVTPRKQKIRRAASFQNKLLNSYYASNPAVSGTQSRKYSHRAPTHRDYLSEDDIFYDAQPAKEIYGRAPSSYSTHYYYNYGPAVVAPLDMKIEDCPSCYYQQQQQLSPRMEKPALRRSNTSVSTPVPIPAAAKNYKFQSKYAKMPEPENLHQHSQIYEEIFPFSKERSKTKLPNPPPDIANISNYFQLENSGYDPEFIRKQPDILQSAYYGSRGTPPVVFPEQQSVDSCFPACSPLCKDAVYLEELKRKSYSLPKSFQRNDRLRTEIKLQENPALLFHWRKHGIKGFLLNKKVVVPSSVMSETAPATPVKDMPEKKKYGRLMKIGQYSSTPSLDDNSAKHINFDCDNRYRRDKYKSNKTATLNSSDFRPTSQENIVSSSNLGDKVFHKFCKSFSLRFLRKLSDGDEDDHKSVSNVSTSGSNKVFCEPTGPPKKQVNRFGPLAWRTSKERKDKVNVSAEKNKEWENHCQELYNKEKELAMKQTSQPRIVRRTLSDLNGYCNIVKDKTVNAIVPTKYRPPVPVVSKKHRQYNLRRTMSQPLLSSKFSPILEKKPPPSRTACSEDERALFSEDDTMSDSGSSVPSRKDSFEQGINEEIVIYAEAVWDHVAIESEELPFSAGDVIEVYNVLDREWWWGMCNGRSGWFPSDFVRLRVNQEETLQNHLSDSPTKLNASLSVYSNDQVRSKIVCELINTERDFVKILQDVKDAYIVECRNAKELFSNEELYKIFGNWEQILSLQIMFLDNIESNLDVQAPHRTCVGSSFIKFQEHFRMYSDYCNNHPLSIATLQQLYQKMEYRNFFEKCRMKKNLIEIPLDGFLLTPVQRICKYPLQLAELLKYTEVEHMDYDSVKNALNAMREVAVLINERKRRMESLEKLVLWQQRIEGWEGNNLIEDSSQLIHQNDVTKVFAGVWSTNVTLFLFDHQLVFCKKDLLKRDNYIYKGRISLDSCEVIDTSDGKGTARKFQTDPLLGISIRHGIKIQNVEKNKWLLFACRTHKEKLEWLEAFKREKDLVLLDERNKLQITPVDRHLAFITATTCNSRHVFSKHKKKKLKRSLHNSGHLSRAAAGGSQYILGKKVGTWFMFGANRKTHRSRINSKKQMTAI